MSSIGCAGEDRGVQGLRVHRAEGHRDGSLNSHQRNEKHLLLEGGPTRILGRTLTERFGEETL